MENQNTMGGLEDRVRNLILGNAEREVTPPLQGAGPHVPASRQSPMGILPFAQQGLEPVRPGQENFSADDQVPSPAFSKGGKKRPNQAQRRQMSAQLSIPIDTRPQMPQSARAYVSPPAYPHHQQYSHGGQTRVQRPHSATFRPPSRGNAAPAPLTGNPFPPHGRHHPSLSYHGPMSSPGEWQPHPPNGDPRSFHGPPMLFDPSSPRASRHGPSGSYGSNKLYHTRPEELRAQTDLLEGLCATVIAGAEIEPADILEKEMFRAKIEEVARSAIAQYERESNGFHSFPPGSVQLKCFGSLSSGFATKAADMDLGLLSPFSVTAPDAPGSPIPRLLEKAFLEIGLGARLLTRTRVPIIKICQRPPEKLRLDLLDERAKWEKGLPDEVDDDDTHDEDTHDADDIQPHDYRHHDPGVSAGEIGSLKPERKFRSLRQGEKKNLSAYYGMAKGLLRKLGGRDYTHSNAIELKEDDLVFLNEFSLAFVDGLADHALRQRLLSCKSLNRYDLTVNRQYRTLLGVYTQIEGEMMAMVWESRKILEKDRVAEQQAQSIIKSWAILGNKPTFNNDPIGYSKELQLALDQLKRISSVQLMILAQSQHESAALYHTRATRVMLELGIHDIPGEHKSELHFVVSQYIKGISTDQVRQEVQEFADSCPKEILTLRAVARRHKSLQLAYEFERCLEKGLYPEASVAAIDAYIRALRTPMIKFSLPYPHFDLVVPLPTEAVRLISQIRQLGDPAQLSPNQPRDPYRDRLEFPKSGVGVQCDVNFSAHLALQNTLLLRCYSHTDPRVRPLVLFVKHWAKVRQINTPYRGTLSSYGYVLMMLHYLVNIAQPFVCPNLQLLAQPPDPNLTPEQIEETVSCKGRNVLFWRDEATIQRLARENTLNQNQDSLGHLLRGFFEYYAQSNQMSTVQSRGFDWGRDVLSLRTPGGLLSKQDKGWTGAKTVVEVKSMAASAAPAGLEQTANLPAQGNQQAVPDPTVAQTQISHGRAPSQTTREIKEVRHRYLFAIEDPFELDHNVARTVTHNGIVAIRDEFRRAWRIIKEAGKGIHQENLLQDVSAAFGDREKKEFSQLLDEIHGPVAEQLGL
ncbi:cid13-like poly(A) RNA polymerase [Immersiella caudata]|uniref:polynucleotide adenylyltransferase n=1 Tax=Immersiella caudata TaxID=314043 RepID=A0AA39WR50_9PEZI|nr:cid13-like poly(A) RNA polymerase [Immersiella caudata]